MRGRLSILTVSTLIIAATALCACAPGEPPATSEYTPVTIGELIANTTKYDGQKVSISGRYTTNIPGYHSCPTVDINSSPEISEEYRVYPSLWVISDNDGRVGVVVIMRGIETSTLPNYIENERIEVRGIARAVNVSSRCLPYIIYRSIYIKVNASDIGIETKPLPSFPPLQSQ